MFCVSDAIRILLNRFEGQKSPIWLIYLLEVIFSNIVQQLLHYFGVAFKGGYCQTVNDGLIVWL